MDSVNGAYFLRVSSKIYSSVIDTGYHIKLLLLILTQNKKTTKLDISNMVTMKYYLRKIQSIVTEYVKVNKLGDGKYPSLNMDTFHIYNPIANDKQKFNKPKYLVKNSNIILEKIILSLEVLFELINGLKLINKNTLYKLNIDIQQIENRIFHIHILLKLVSSSFKILFNKYIFEKKLERNEVIERRHTTPDSPRKYGILDIYDNKHLYRIVNIDLRRRKRHLRCMSVPGIR